MATRRKTSDLDLAVLCDHALDLQQSVELERDGRRLDEFDLYILRHAGDLAPFERERRRALPVENEA